MKSNPLLHPQFVLHQLRTNEILSILQKLEFDCDSLFCGLKDTTLIFMESDIYLGITSPLQSTLVTELSQKIMSSTNMSGEHLQQILAQFGVNRALIIRKTQQASEWLQKCSTLWDLVLMQISAGDSIQIVEPIPRTHSLFFHPMFPTVYKGLQIFLNQFCKPEENLLLGVFEGQQVLFHLLVQIKDRKIYKVSQNPIAHKQLDSIAHDWQNMLKKSEGGLNELFPDSDLLGLFIDANELEELKDSPNPLSGFLKQLIQGRHLFIHPSIKLRVLLYQQIAKNFLHENLAMPNEE